MRFFNRTAGRTAQEKRNRKLKIGAATLAVSVITTAGAVSARAEDGPTVAELLEACDWADYCEFFPSDFWTTLSDEHQVGSSAWNCSDSSQRLTISWSDTKGSSNTVGVAVTTEYKFSQVFSASVQVSYGHTWENSHTWGESPSLDIPAGRVGWITFGTPEANSSGEYELHFGERYYGHYYWYIQNYVQNGPDQDGNGQVSFHTRDIEPDEWAEHCSSVDPVGSGVGSVRLSEETVPFGNGVTSTTLTKGQQSQAGPAIGSPSVTPGND